MKRAAICVVGLLFACFCACGAPAADEAPGEFDSTLLLPSMTQDVAQAMQANDDARPLSYMRAEQEYGDSGFISYPYLMDEEYDAINSAIQGAIRAELDALDAPAYTRCDIMCNDCGLLSVRIAVRDLAGETLAIVPLTFNTATCGQIALADLFDPENERWRGLIPDIVMLQAEKAGLTLLCDVMPASDDQAFYVTEDALVILYRPYEIATYSAGWPEFAIPLSQLTDFFLPDGLMMRLVNGGTAAMESLPGIYDWGFENGANGETESESMADAEITEEVKP